MKLVILDRDGTINHERDDYIKSPEEWVPLPGAIEAIARLNHAGWHVVVATNQSGIGRGLFDMAAMNAMHAKMHQMLARHGGRVDAVFFCPHTPEDQAAAMTDVELVDLRRQVPGLTIHPDLSAFADFLILRDRAAHGEDGPVATHMGEFS